MSDVNTIKCDECGKLRINDSNHWLEGASDGIELKLRMVRKLDDPQGYTKHFCGQECAMKWVGVKVGELRS